MMNTKNEHENLMEITEARAKIQAAIEPIRSHQSCSLAQAVDRVLSEAIESPLDVPPYINSAMDGYAFRYADVQNQDRVSLVIADTVYAGKPFHGTLEANQCVRIMTGAVLPEGLDTVIMREWVDDQQDSANFATDGVKKGNHVRYPGENIRKGQKILHAGKRLTPADIGVLASLGIEEVQVIRIPRVAFFSTGDELKEPGIGIGEGQIYDSNRYCILGVLQRLGVNYLDLGIVPDQPETIEKTMLRAAEEADVIITSGGVSVGDADHVKNILDKIAKTTFWKVAMKPGKPFTFGHVNQAVFFGLPGNPVSVMATYYQLVQPALYKLMGCRSIPMDMRLQARCVNRLKKTPGRTDFQRGILQQQEDGEWIVESVQGQDSHILSSMSQANCFIVLPAQAGDVEANQKVQVQPFMGLI